MTMKYLCDLDHIVSSNNLCWERQDDDFGSVITFLDCTEFAQMQAGLAWRSKIHNTVDILAGEYDHKVGAYIITDVDYRNDVKSELGLSVAPGYFSIAGEQVVSLAHWLNRQIRIMRYDDSAESVFTRDEVEALECMYSIFMETGSKIIDFMCSANRVVTIEMIPGHEPRVIHKV